MKPNYITEAHWQEWTVGSGIDPELTALNIVSLEGYEPHEYLLYALPDKCRRNDGRLRDWILRKYSHIENGGWWGRTVDILTGEESRWGCFKPNVPRQQEKYGSGGKIQKIKYEHPPGVATEIFAPKVSLAIWKAIALRYNVPLPENIVTEGKRAVGFWKWILNNPQIPLFITEGEKKGGALLTASYAAIALSGVNGGYRQPRDSWGHKIGNPFLIPQLKALATGGREFIFCFDSDQKAKTKEMIKGAVLATGRLLIREGAKVSVCHWDYPEKGIDDVYVRYGASGLDKIYKSRTSFEKFDLQTFTDLSKYNGLQVSQPFLDSNLVPPSDAQIIALKSAKGTGKTEWMANQVGNATSDGRRTLVASHREQLSMGLSGRFGIDYRTEIRGSSTKGALGYSLCVDSLHPNANPPFNPSEWEGASVVIDEVEQVVWHMLDSSTCQANRVAIIENFKQLLLTVIGTGGKIYLADADLSSIAIDYIRSLIGFPVKVWLVENTYKKVQQRKLVTYSGNDPNALIAGLVDAISLGEKVIVHTTGQKARSRYGSINLESYLKKRFPHKRILRIDRESVAEPGHPAYGCMGNLNSVLLMYDIVICSPVVETGVSIDIKGHFDSVWCIAYGVQTVDAVCQSIERVRDDVPRHIWIKKTAKNNRIGNGSSSIRSLLRSQHKLTQVNLLLLQQAGMSEFDLEIDFSRESLNAWAKRACLINQSKCDYRKETIEKLLSEGYAEEGQEVLPESTGITSEGLKSTREENYNVYCDEVCAAENPTDAQLEELKNKRNKTKAERIQEKKGRLAATYGVTVTPELIKKDDKGLYKDLLRQYYFATPGAKHLHRKEKNALEELTTQGGGKAFKPDINKKLLTIQIRLLQELNMMQFLDTEKEFCINDLDDWLIFVRQQRGHIQTILGISIHPEKDTGISIANRILKKIGMRLVFKHWRGTRATRARYYSISPVGELEKEILAQWLIRDDKALDKCNQLVYA